MLDGRALHRLAYPPGCIGGKTTPPLRIEFLHGLHEPEIALFDQIGQQHTPANVTSRYLYHQSEIGFDHALAGRLVTTPQPPRKFLFLLARQKRMKTYFTQIQVDDAYVFAARRTGPLARIRSAGFFTMRGLAELECSVFGSGFLGALVQSCTTLRGSSSSLVPDLSICHKAPSSLHNTVASILTFRRKKSQRINRRPVFANLEIQRGLAIGRTTHRRDFLAAFHGFPFLRQQTLIVAVGTQPHIVVLDDDQPAVAHQGAACINHRAACRRHDRLAERPLDDDALAGHAFRAETTADLPFCRPLPGNLRGSRVGGTGAGPGAL